MIEDLIQLLGPANVLVERERTSKQYPYSFDATAALRKLPAVVVFPRTTAEVSAILGSRSATGSRGPARERDGPERRERPR